jgi:DNA-binding CsgD family transcriptional regulator
VFALLGPNGAGKTTTVARGRTNAEIGQALFISEATVKTHLLRAFGK